jgi:hypothetical protein
MPCYTPWYGYSHPGSPEFARALKAVHAKLRAVKHVVDYYYEAYGLSLPSLPDGAEIDPMRQPRAPSEYRVREMICHHLACDGIDFMGLFDVASVLDDADKGDRAYLAVIRPCSMLMKQHTDKFVVAYPKYQEEGNSEV